MSEIACTEKVPVASMIPSCQPLESMCLGFLLRRRKRTVHFTTLCFFGACLLSRTWGRASKKACARRLIIRRFTHTSRMRYERPRSNCQQKVTIHNSFLVEMPL
jgi:hypothetical protein